jgi:hypothetical protein
MWVCSLKFDTKCIYIEWADGNLMWSYKDLTIALFTLLLCFDCGLGSSVGIATGYGLDGSGIESRWGRGFLNQTGPGAYPASCIIGTGFFPGLESGRGVTLTPHLLLVPRSKNRLALYLCSP